MHSPPDIVVTAMGLVTHLGLTPQSTWDAVLAGTRALGLMRDIEQQPLPNKGGGQCVDLPPDFFPDLPRESRYLRFAIDHALAQAGPLTAPSCRRAAIFGTTLHGIRAGGRYLRSQDLSDLQAFLPSAVLDRALENLDIGGPRITNCSACSSGLASISLAITLLSAGEIDMAIAGGYDPISEYSYAGFESLRLIAASAPRPFSLDRDGMKVAEGYGVLFLERAQSAQFRGVTPLARIAAIAESSDAFHLTQPHPQGRGAAQAIHAALDAAHAAISDIDMICAHGTATPNNDAAEYAALECVFKEALPTISVTALKSHLGHTLGGAGAVELIVSILARHHSTVPPVASVTAIDPAFTKLNLVRAPVRRTIRTSLNLSLGFGGANACAVITDPRSTPADFTPPQRRAVVVTGFGVMLPAAIGNHAFRELHSQPLTRQPTAATLTGEQLEGFINARRVRRMNDYTKVTLAAANQTCMSAGIVNDTVLLASCTAILATTHGSNSYCYEFYSQVVREGIAAANPVLFAEGVPNAASAQLSLALGLRGGCQTLIGTRNSLIDAINLAALRIGQGECERSFVGAGEEHFALGDEAYTACGMGTAFQSSSGAVVFLLESLESARRRNAHIFATFVQGAWCSNGPGSLAVLLKQFPPAALIAGPWGQSRGDLRELAALPAIPRICSGDRFAELFSVGAGIGLAAALVQASLSPARIAVCSTEFSGNAAASFFDLSPTAPQVT